ncbi:MAG: hypothetical protein GY754_21650, partial [bacterium]|nr:hypothetical protein [bacterium]
LELPKLADKIKDDKLSKWLLYFKKEGTEEELMKILLKDDPDLKKAHDEYLNFTRDDELREMYEAREKWIKDQNNALANAEARGEARGEERGEARGEVKEKQTLLIRSMAKRFKLSEKEKAFIKSVTDYDKLDRAYNLAFDRIIDGNVDDASKKEILDLL